MSNRGADRWFFDAWSLGYDFAIPQRLAYRPVHDAVLQALKAGVRGDRLLDIGCGTGELAVRVREAFPRIMVVGCDFSAGMLGRAAAKGDAAHWVQGDACRLPFRDGAFDVITSTEAFHWFPDQDRALREFRRVLSPGGHLLLALGTPPLRLLGALANAGSRLIAQPFYWPTQPEIRQRLVRAGFCVEEQHRVFRFPGLLLLPLLTSAVRPGLGNGSRRSRPLHKGGAPPAKLRAGAAAKVKAARKDFLGKVTDKEAGRTRSLLRENVSMPEGL